MFIGAIAAGLFSISKDSRTRKLMAIFILCIIPPFLFTQSRASYLALIPVIIILGLFSRHKVIALGLIIAALLISPIFLPSVVKQRIMFTFQQSEEAGQINIGGLKLDTSTSARLESWKNALNAWSKRPIIGYGVTGYSFIDAQYPRVLVETGAMGLVAFVFLLYSVFRLAIKNAKSLNTSYFKGISIGFLAGYVGLLVHALGANTFIIVRIMEPFWFFAAIMVVLPILERRQVTAENAEEVTGTKLAPAS